MKRRSIMMIVGMVLVMVTVLVACAKSDGQYPISQTEAKEIAVRALGVEIEKTSYAVVTKPSGTDDSLYTVEIMLEGVVYRYGIDAQTGDVHKLYINDEQIALPDAPTLPGGEKDPYIGLESAKQIAFEDLGINESQLTAFEYEMDFAYGAYLYKIEFTVDNIEYEYEIRATDGTVFKKDVEKNTVVEPQVDSKTFIGIEKAKEAVLNHAALAKDEAEFLRIEWDMEKGSAVYEVKFATKEGKYEYKIHAETGEVIRYETDVKNSSSENTDLTHQHITKEEAKRIVLAHAGVKEEQIRSYEAEPDFERGVEIYEIEFKVGKTEYEYKINVNNGEILKAEREID